MIFYQQGAVINKRLSVRTIRRARQDTAFGAALAQFIVIMVVVELAAIVGLSHSDATLNSVGKIADALTPFSATSPARSSSAWASWAPHWSPRSSPPWLRPGGWPRSSAGNTPSTNAPTATPPSSTSPNSLAHVLGAVLVLTSLDLVSLAVDVEVMNALLLPIVLGFLLALEAKALPAQWQMRGWHKRTTWFLCLLVIAFGLYMIPKTLGIPL